MKEVIYFVGKGFLAVIIGGLVWSMVCYSASSFSRNKRIQSDESLYQYVIDAAYIESMVSNDVQLEWVYQGAIPQITDLSLDRFFHVNGNQTASFVLSIVSVFEEMSGNRVPYENGKYYFPRSGIYRIYVRCGDAIYLIRVPVNVVEDEG